MKKILFFILTIIIFYPVVIFAQNTVYMQRIKPDTIEPKNCINCKNYSHFFSGILINTDIFDNNLPIHTFGSGEYFLGYRKKFKIICLMKLHHFHLYYLQKQ